VRGIVGIHCGQAIAESSDAGKVRKAQGC
jgi:hypothetical protein